MRKDDCGERYLHNGDDLFHDGKGGVKVTEALCFVMFQSVLSVTDFLKSRPIK